MNLKKYVPWLILFFLLLGMIPVLLHFQYMIMAKVVGVVTVVSVSLALRMWLVSAQKSSTNRIRLNTNDKFWLNTHVPFYSNLSKEDQLVFVDRMGIFIKSIYMRTAEGRVPDREDCLLVAAHYVQFHWEDEFALPTSYQGVVWGISPESNEHEVQLDTLRDRLKGKK